MNSLVEAAQRDDAYADCWSRLQDALDQGTGVEGAVAAAADFPAIVAARLAALHNALWALGLPAADLGEESGRLAAVSEKFVTLTFADAAARETKMEMARNGSAFLGGRRYEAALSRVSLSDAEIARTSILRVDIDRSHGAVIVTFLTLDGRPARLRMEAAHPGTALVEGRIPEAAHQTMKARPDSASLAEPARVAIAATERREAGKGFFHRLFDGAARRAHADLRILAEYCASPCRSADESGNWAQRPEAMRQVAEALVRRLSAEGAAASATLVRALVAAGIGSLLGAPPAGVPG